MRTNIVHLHYSSAIKSPATGLFYALLAGTKIALALSR